MVATRRILLKLSGEALAGEKKTGFHEDTVRKVALQVKALADEIKKLVAEVNGSIGDVEEGTAKLNGSINSSQAALGESLGKVDNTYAMFDKITEAAEGATSVQEEISRAIDDSHRELESLEGFFGQTRESYREVMNHINAASKLGTTKSAMFEDVDNMLSQIPPMIADYDS